MRNPRREWERLHPSGGRASPAARLQTGPKGVTSQRLANVVSMLGQRRRRWPNIETTLVQRPVFTGIIRVTAPGMRKDVYSMLALCWAGIE